MNFMVYDKGLQLKMPIQILSDIVVAQIAAGEVVERPTSVVKEVVENAIDADARHIRIELSGGGRQRIRISDDGIGIPTEEVPLAFHRHATSKLQSIDDLISIQTLGFRGEALASIASVSQLTLVTRNATSEAGTLLQLSGSQMVRHQSIGAPLGTVLTVENLFYNTPARLKFLKKENTEKRQIALFVTRYAMAYPHIRFVLEQDGRETFRSGGSGDLADVVVAALGLESFKNMVMVNAQEDDTNTQKRIQITGYTSVPSLHRADRNHITLFVNGRWIQDTRLSYAIIQAYHTFLMTGRYPVTLLMITVPPEDVDVNVHPTKAEVRFRDPDAVFAAVQRAVRRAVINLAQTPAMRASHFNHVSLYPHTSTSNWTSPTHSTQLDLDVDYPTSGQHRRMPLTPTPNSTDPTAIPYGPEAPSNPRKLPILRVVGQINATYIVAEGPSGLYLVDQHAAHERILFEQFMAEQSQKKPITQFVLDAQTIHLPPIETRLLEEHLNLLSQLGFTLEPFGPNTFVIRSVPALLADQAPEEVINSVLAELDNGFKPGEKVIEEKIITHICKRAAIKSGQILSHEEMQSIIRQLERCNSPHTCPHGRPTMLHLSAEQLAREFGRLG
jgi:DNA mismatch repair protein MutL